MWYTPYLRVRTAISIYAYFVIGLSLLGIAANFWPGVVDARHRAEMATLHVDLSVLVNMSALVVGGFATLLGLNLAAENDGHLEVAWTKPVSREGYALGVFAVDIGAMAASLLLTLICIVVALDIHAGHQAVVIDPKKLLETLAFCSFPICIYGWVTAISASLKHNRGAVAGLFWPLMLVIVALQFVPIPVIHAVASAINVVNPLGIYTPVDNPGLPSSIWTYLWGLVLAVFLLAVAMFQWRRLQL